jgi:hypothetical protein
LSRVGKIASIIRVNTVVTQFRSPLSAAPRTALLAALLLGLTLTAPGVASAAGLPSFSFAPQAPLTGEVVTFASDFTNVTSQDWDLDGNGTCDDATGQTAQRSFESAGVYTVRLCVTDGSNKATFERAVTVQNRPPLAAFMFSPPAPYTGDVVVVSSTSTDPDGPIINQAWDLDNDGAFDDGTSGIARLSFSRAGSYTVRLLVTDRDGATSIASHVINVTTRPFKLLSPFPIVRVIATVADGGTRFRQVSVVAPAGSKVKLRCRGRRCPFRAVSHSASVRARPNPLARTSAVVRIRRLRNRILGPGTVLQVWVTKGNRIGKYTRFRVRRHKPPRRADRCVLPGAKLPSRCPS